MKGGVLFSSRELSFIRPSSGLLNPLSSVVAYQTYRHPSIHLQEQLFSTDCFPAASSSTYSIIPDVSF
ncbi:MAG: hypothetical protein QXO30_03095 [Candidatus Caldarchaeum sp.]